MAKNKKSRYVYKGTLPDPYKPGMRSQARLIDDARRVVIMPGGVRIRHVPKPIEENDG